MIQSKQINFANLTVSSGVSAFNQTNVTIGTDGGQYYPGPKLSIINTQEQLRIGYDNGSYSSFTTQNGTGALNINSVGDDPGAVGTVSIGLNNYDQTGKLNVTADTKVPLNLTQENVELSSFRINGKTGNFSSTLVKSSYEGLLASIEGYIRVDIIDSNNQLNGSGLYIPIYKLMMG